MVTIMRHSTWRLAQNLHLIVGLPKELKPPNLVAWRGGVLAQHFTELGCVEGMIQLLHLAPDYKDGAISLLSWDKYH
jgi:hypothetical protein